MVKRSSVAATVLSIALVCINGFAATISTHPTTTHKSHKSSHHITESASTQKTMAHMQHSSATVARRNRATHVAVVHKHHYSGERFHASSFAEDQTLGDVTAGEDPVVR